MHGLVPAGSRSSQWSRTTALPWPFLLDCPLCCLLSLTCHLCVCVYIYMVSFAFKLERVYAKFSRKTNCKLVWFIHGLLHYKPLRVCVSHLLCFSLCCTASSASSLLPSCHCLLPILSLWWKRCHVRGLTSCKHRDNWWSQMFFSGEWCPTHPSIALSHPVDSCYSLWRSQSLGPDEQGLIHLTGRYLSTSNHCREKSRRWEGLCEVSTMNSADVST